MKKGLGELLGQTIEHKVFGHCEIVDIIDEKEGKFTGKILSDSTLKKFVFSKQYFINVDEYKTKKIEVKKPTEQKREYKKVDLSKYRNHPLVKDIDRRESRTKSMVTLNNNDDDEADDYDD